jgi:hypothetical protein
LKDERAGIMKLLGKQIKSATKTILATGCLLAVGGTLSAQVYTASLADLANGGTLSVGDKVFSGFSYLNSDLTSFNPSQIMVTASESGGVDYLTWTGNISFVSSGVASADLLLNYMVTANSGAIDMIDQSFTGSAQNGFLAIDETAATGTFGGPVVGSTHLQVGNNSDSDGINPAQPVLYMTTDIGLAVASPNGGFITVSQIGQSFHQLAPVPEPSVTLLGSLGGGLLLILGLRRQSRRV